MDKRSAITLLAGAAIAVLGFGSAAVADDLPPPISPLVVQADRNGINLVDGKMTPQALVLSVPADPRLKFDLVQNAAPFVKSNVARDFDNSDDMSAVSTVHLADGTSEGFHCAIDGVDGKVCAAGSAGTGSMMNFGATTFTHGGTGEVYALNDAFEYYVPPPSIDGSPADQTIRKVFYASSVTWPDGEVISYTYDKSIQVGLATFILHRPTKLSSNRGYYIVINYGCGDSTQSCWYEPTDAAIYAASSPNNPIQKYIYDNTAGTITDLAGRVYRGFGPGDLGNELEVASYSRTLPTEATPALAVTPATGLSSGFPMVGTVNRDGVQWNYSYANATYYSGIDGYLYDSVTVTGPNQYRKVYTMTHTSALSPVGSRNLVSAVTDELNRQTTYQYEIPSGTNGSDVRVVKVTYPEGNSTTVQYDDAGNIISKTNAPKPGSGLASTVEQTFVDLTPYQLSSGYINCNGQVNCYRPTWFKDALSRETDFRYNSNGQLTKQLDPPDQTGAQRLTLITYQPSPAGISRKSLVQICRSSSASIDAATCSGNADSHTEYNYFGDTDLPLTVTEKDEASGAQRTTTFAYDNAGRPTMIDGPLAGTGDAKYFRYVVLGRKILEVGELAPNNLRLATITRYRDSDDKPIGTVTGTVSCTTACDTASLSVTVQQQTDATYDSRRNAIRAITYKGSTTYSVTDSSFLDNGLAECVAVRMDLLNLPATSDHGACSLGTSGAAEADRITKNTYDAAGQLTLIQKAFATALQANYASYSYSANGKQASVTDANGNKAAFVYDGFDRLSQWQFPSKTVPGQVNTADFEQYAYDLVGNRTCLRKRDGSKLVYTFDGLNRITSKVVAATSGGTCP